MEFWGVEVKAGEPIKCDPGFKNYLHLSQASLGEVKKDKGNDSIPLFVEVSGKKLVLGKLSPDNCTHISFDLVFEKEFELSHNWKNGSVYFCGYKSVPEDSDDFTDTDSEEDLSLLATQNGKQEVKVEKSKPMNLKSLIKDEDKDNESEPKPFIAARIGPNVANLKSKQAEIKKAKDEDDDEDDDEDYESEEEDSDDDEDMVEAGASSDDDEDGDDESSEEEDEVTPKKAEMGKKRPAESATKTPVPEKKAKLVSPSGEKKGADGKKGGHMATPYPSNKGGKTPASNDKSKPQTPKSGNQVTCKSCSRTFNSENALESHTKAKHTAGK